MLAMLCRCNATGLIAPNDVTAWEQERSHGIPHPQWRGIAFYFFRKEPKLQLAETITHLADENARLADENERLRRDQRRLHAYILGKENSGGKSDLEWINNAHLAAAHFALTTRGDYSYANAATTLIWWRPAIRKLLKKNRSSTSFTDEERIIQLRKNFNSGRATKNKAIRVAYRSARKAINRCKGDPDALEELARSLIRAIERDMAKSFPTFDGS